MQWLFLIISDDGNKALKIFSYLDVALHEYNTTRHSYCCLWNKKCTFLNLKSGYCVFICLVSFILSSSALELACKDFLWQNSCIGLHVHRINKISRINTQILLSYSDHKKKDLKVSLINARSICSSFIALLKILS